VAETQLILFMDDHPDQSPADVPPQAKSADNTAPPFAIDRLPSIPLVNPDRQLTFGGAPHDEWPKPRDSVESNERSCPTELIGESQNGFAIPSA
jgi:hypothetical protein